MASCPPHPRPRQLRSSICSKDGRLQLSLLCLLQQMAQSQREVEREQEVLRQQEVECRKYEERINILTKKRDALEKKKETAMKKVPARSGVGEPVVVVVYLAFIASKTGPPFSPHSAPTPGQTLFQGEWGGKPWARGWVVAGGHLPSMGEGPGSWRSLLPRRLFRAKKRGVSSNIITSSASQ